MVIGIVVIIASINFEEELALNVFVYIKAKKELIKTQAKRKEKSWSLGYVGFQVDRCFVIQATGYEIDIVRKQQLVVSLINKKKKVLVCLIVQSFEDNEKETN